MPPSHLTGRNVIDPELVVTRGEDYTLEITERSLRNIRELGHEAVEYSHACHWTEAECAHVREMTAAIGLKPWSLHAWAGGDVLVEKEARRTVEVLTIAVRNALALGVGVIVHHPSGLTPHRERVAREAELIAGVWQPGVRFALENSETMASLEYAIDLCDRLGPDRAGICVDTGHAALGDLGPARAIRTAGPRLITTHIQDNHGQSDEHLPPFDGTIDGSGVAEALAEIRYPGCLMLELTDQPSTDRRAGIKEELARGAAAAKWLAERVP
jgi:sugar phosphate isomerase/epimerase